jgi:hypothetical protein
MALVVHTALTSEHANSTLNGTRKDAQFVMQHIRRVADLTFSKKRCAWVWARYLLAALKQRDS